MKSVPLGKQRYRVRLVQDATLHAARKDNELEHHGPLRGYIDWKRREIVLEVGEPKLMASTLLHEMLHGAFSYLDDETILEAEERLFPTLWRYGWRPFG